MQCSLYTTVDLYISPSRLIASKGLPFGSIGCFGSAQLCAKEEDGIALPDYY